jgi:all-trans-retinol 13,14-reductase
VNTGPALEPGKAVVIGSGVGGLTAAILLAMRGWEVDVFEQHYRPGGLLHRFFRQGSPYDTGFHYCGGIQHEDILGRTLRHLGVFEDINFLPLDPDGFDRLLFDDYEFRVPVGVEAYRARLKSEFPHETAGIDAFVNAMEQSVNEYGLYKLRTNVNVKEFLRWEECSLSSFIDQHVRDPQLKAVLCGQCVLYGVAAKDAPFGLHAVILHHFLSGANRVEGGGDRLAKVMVRRLRKLGGRLHLKTGVDQVLVEDRKACGVRLDDGSEVRADFVVSNMHPLTLLDHLPEGAVRKVYKNRVRDTRVGGAHMGVYIQLDAPPTAIGNANVYRAYDLDPDRSFEDVEPGNLPFYYATAPGEGLLKPRKTHNVVLMLSALDYSRMKGWENLPTGNRGPEYTAYKEALKETMVEGLLNDFPSLRPHVVRVEGSTPLSTRHFTRSPAGAMYGHYHSVDQMGRYRPSQVIRVRNLLQVGHAVFTPGVLGATLSAYYGLGYFLGLKTLLDELKATPA